MSGRDIFTGAVLVLAVSAAGPGCGGNGSEGKPPSIEGKAAPVLSAEGFTYFESQKDPFNPGNMIESTRKSRLTSFGNYRGALPPPTLTMDALGAAINLENMPQFNIDLFQNNALVFTTFPFDYENDLASLKSLHTLHALDAVIGKDLNEMESFAALCTYTNRFLEGGKSPEPEASAGPSAFLITRNMKEKGISGGSGVYAALMCQLALSCGATARVVGMHTFDGKDSLLTNDVCEVFVNELGKWVAFDPLHRATYYLRESVPQSALELHRLAMEQRFREITPVSGVGDATDVSNVREKVLPLYRYLYMWRMNDILGKSPRNGSIPWQNLYDCHLVWEDRWAPVSQGRFEKIDKFSKSGVRFVTHTRTDFEWNLDIVNITVTRTGMESLNVIFNTVTPNFDRFKLMFGYTQVKTGNVFPMKDTFRSIGIGSVNSFGIAGPASYMNVVK
jgi:hypothetical protein